MELLNEIGDAWNGRDRAALRARFADDVVVEDHRHTGIGRIEGSAAYVDANAVLWDLAPDQRIEFGSSFLAFDRHGLVATLRRAGTLPDGGAFESEYVWLSLARDGRITHLELFEVEQQGAALARFEELRPDPLWIPPNAATRVMESIRGLVMKGDREALRARVTDDFCFDDRGRRAQLRGGVEEWLGALEFVVTEIHGRLGARLVATAGDRLALYHDFWNEAPGDPSFQMESYRLIEVDATGKLRALTLFDPRARAAAQAELFERYVASAPRVSRPPRSKSGAPGTRTTSGVCARCARRLRAPRPSTNGDRPNRGSRAVHRVARGVVRTQSRTCGSTPSISSPSRLTASSR